MAKPFRITLTACSLLAFLAAGCGRQLPVASAWQEGEYVLTNTSDKPVHHVRIKVVRHTDGRTFERFLPSLDAHTTKTYRWNERFSPAQGGKITVTCHGYSGKQVIKIKK